MFRLAASETLEIRQDSCEFLPCQTKNFSRQSAYRHLLVQLLTSEPKGRKEYLPCFAVAAVYSGEQNGLHQMYYFRALSSEIIHTGGEVVVNVAYA